MPVTSIEVSYNVISSVNVNNTLFTINLVVPIFISTVILCWSSKEHYYFSIVLYVLGYALKVNN